MEHQEGLGNTRAGRETNLGWEGRLFRESRLGRETSLGFEGTFYRRSMQDRDIKLNRDIVPWLGGGSSRKSRLGRESRLSRETSLWWEGRLCRESWLGMTYSNRFIYHINPNFSPPPLFLILPGAFWGLLTNPDFFCLFIFYFFWKRVPQLLLCSAF